MEVVADVAGPGDRSGVGFEGAWLAGTLEGGCEVSGEDAVAIEIHLAEENRHSFPFALGSPQSAEARATAVVDIGDEGYVDEAAPQVVARKGLVEVALYPPMFGDDAAVMAVEHMVEVAKRILEPWPSGPGADTSPNDTPPDVPLPQGADPEDWTKFDAAEFNRLSIESGGPEVYPVELMPVTWSIQFAASAAERDRFCADLRVAGFTEDALAELYDGDAPDLGPCIGTDGRWLVVVTGVPDSDTSAMSAVDWNQSLRKMRICSDPTQLPEEDRFHCE